jgi:hypothetical protein
MVNKILSNKYNNVLFVDPNAVAANDTVDIYNISTSPENIRPHLEFYCIPRIGNNITLDKNNKAILSDNNSINNIKVNFLGFDSNTGHYTNKYLTDIYNQERTDNFEGFGITNINIKISANYVPEVNIEFIDIKGRSISDINSPYRRLFDVPPPLFKLIVKGGYGLFTEFDLYITKHEISSDESQNLIIKADFIGDRYGVLTDVLLGYLNSVYFMESNSTGIDISSQTKATSFYEFMSRSKVLYSNVDKFKKNSSLFKKQEAIQEKINKIKEVDDNIKNLLSIDELLSQIKSLYETNSTKYTLVNNNLISSPNIINIGDNEFSIELDKIFVSDYIKTVKKQFSDLLFNINSSFPEFGLNYNIDEDIEILTFTNQNNSLGLRFTKIIEKNKNYLSTLEKELKSTNELLAKEAEDIVFQTISSKPTIGNIFSFILKDTDKFLKLLKQSGDEGGKRTLRINNNIKTRGGYPTVINNSGKVIYPGILDEFKDFPEVKFVEKYLNALINKKLTDSEIDRQFISQGTNTTQTGNESYIPISVDESFSIRKSLGVENYYYNINNDFRKIFTNVFLRYVVLRDSIYYNQFNNENILTFYAKAEARNIVYSMIANKKMLDILTKKGFDTLNKSNYYEDLVRTIFNNQLPEEIIKINKGKEEKIPFEIGLIKEKIDYLSTSNKDYNSLKIIKADENYTFSPSQVTISSTNDIISEYINGQKNFIDNILDSFVFDDLNKLEFNQNFFFNKDKNYNNELGNSNSDFLNLKDNNILTKIFNYIVGIETKNNLYSFFQTATIKEYNFSKDSIDTTNGISIDVLFNSLSYSSDASYFRDFITKMTFKLSTPSLVEIPYLFILYFGYILKEMNKSNSTFINDIGRSIDFQGLNSNIDEQFFIDEYNSFLNNSNLFEYKILPESTDENEKFFLDNFLIKRYILVKNNNCFRILKQESKRTFSQVNDNKINTYLKHLISEMLNVAKSYLSDLNKEEQKIRSEINDNDLKEQVYYNFKTIYERYLYNKEYKPFADNNGIPLEQSFQFVDRVYKDISQDVILTYDKLVQDSKTDDISIYTSISNLLSHNNFIFFPFQNFIASGDGNLEEWIKCFQVSNTNIRENQSKPSFVCMFTGGYSNYLNIDNNSPSYPDDGVKIYNFDENSNYVINNNLPQDFLSGNTIYCFRYNYGQQNEAVFNGINLSTTQFNNTDASLKIQDSVINQQYNSNPISKGQSLLNIYRNLSYTLSSGIYYGNVCIQPTQYIQLDNVPLFNGLYMIYEVEHKMSTNNRLETSFKAYRINKYVIRLVTDIALDIFGIDTGVNSSQNEINTTNTNNSNDTLFLQSKVKENSTQFVQKAQDIATKFNINPDWLMLVIDTETGFNDNVIRGRVNNNVGLTQLLPITIQELINQYKLNISVETLRNRIINAPYVNINSNGLDKTKGFFYTGNHDNNDQLDYFYMYYNIASIKNRNIKDIYPSFYHMKAFGFEPYGVYVKYLKSNSSDSEFRKDSLSYNPEVLKYNSDVIGKEGIIENMIQFFNNKMKKEYKYPIENLVS